MDEVHRRQLQAMFSHLSDEEREIVALRYGLDRGEPRTLEEVAVQTGTTREEVREVVSRAFRHDGGSDR
ncbi:MAG: sigma factor-like helix-turn-helix DNA-binding protein [Acidimicrobiales bacterium]